MSNEGRTLRGKRAGQAMRAALALFALYLMSVLMFAAMPLWFACFVAEIMFVSIFAVFLGVSR